MFILVFKNIGRYGAASFYAVVSLDPESKFRRVINEYLCANLVGAQINGSNLSNWDGYLLYWIPSPKIICHCYLTSLDLIFNREKSLMFYVYIQLKSNVFNTCSIF